MSAPETAAASLDVLLTDAALGTGRMLRPDSSTLAFLAALAGPPGARTPTSWPRDWAGPAFRSCRCSGSPR
jgi:hypothetical protein